MAEILHAEISAPNSRRWQWIDTNAKERIKLRFDFVSKFDGDKILLHPNSLFDHQSSRLKRFEEYVTKFIERNSSGNPVSSPVLQYHRRAESLQATLSKMPNFREQFRSISFGTDVAEQDDNLMSYFLETNAYSRVAAFQKGIVIGPKGSGKSSILKAIVSQHASAHAIVITPEIFATSMLKRILEEGDDAWEEERAFVATWEFTILFEVFKHIVHSPKNTPANTVKELKRFLESQSDYVDADLFSRFIIYLRRIQTVKLGDVELSIKTRALQELFSLEPLYQIILKVRHQLRQRVLILIDELDQGWDNSEHSNRFLAGLLQAAVQIQNLGIQAKVIVLVRSEIFDLVRSRLAQLDKLRSSIERLKWSDGEIMNLVAKRLVFHFGSTLGRYDAKDILNVFFERTRAAPGFDYIISRTARRPREVLQFARLAHQYAAEANAVSITEEHLFRAEEDFSTWKIEHIAAEYLHIYPNLEKLLRAFRGMQSRIMRIEIEELIDQLRLEEAILDEWFQQDYFELVTILYQVEFLGTPRSARSAGTIREVDEFEFSYEAAFPNLKIAEEFLIHPAVWKALELVA